MKIIDLSCYMTYACKHVRGYKKIVQVQFLLLSLLSILCFDGLELFLVYKLQYKEAAPDGNGVYFCSMYSPF